MSTEADFLEQWRTFFLENWEWAGPMMLAFMSPIIATLIGISYDHAKTKGWI